MTILIIIIAYIANVFLNRWLNKVLHKIDQDFEPIPFIWLLAFFSSIAYLIIIINTCLQKTKYNDWLTGKNLDKE